MAARDVAVQAATIARTAAQAAWDVAQAERAAVEERRLQRAREISAIAVRPTGADNARMTHPILDAQPFWHPANSRFPAGRDLQDYPLRGYTWRIPIGPLNQGEEGECIGFGFAGDLAARPVEVTGIDNSFARGLFADARAIDRAAGRHYPSGATLLAGAQATQARGLISRYEWTRDLHDAARVVGYRAPVILALPWHSGMYRAPDGRLTISGELVGWHCILWRAVSVKRHTSTLRNSWGDWGLGGDAEIDLDELGTLFEAGAFACKLSGRRLVRA